MITTLPIRIEQLPDALGAAARQIFRVGTSTGRAVIPAPMERWAAQQFGDLALVREQPLVSVTNWLTLDAALFNPLRAMRPGGSATPDDAALEAQIAAELADDIFAEPAASTTEDVFGRVQGRYCTSASNVAKCDTWHGLVIFDTAHPWHWQQEQVADYLSVAGRWLALAHQHDPAAIYPAIVWNCLPKSGASIVHGHMQMLLSRVGPYARTEAWRRAAVAYTRHCGRAYFDDLYAIHAALGLSIELPAGVRGFVHLTPARNHELVLLAAPHAWDAIADALFYVLHRFYQHGIRAFNAGIAAPPLRPDGTDWADYPLVARIGTRGAPLSTRSDIGAMELYGTPCITVDPFLVADWFRPEQKKT